MNIHTTDIQTIGETSAQAFQLFQMGPVNALVQMQNVGVNDIAYVFQAYLDGTWTDIDELGTVANDTLEPEDTVSVPIESDSNQVRVMASASGGSTLTFGILQSMDRVSGGALPVINF